MSVVWTCRVPLFIAARSVQSETTQSLIPGLYQSETSALKKNVSTSATMKGRCYFCSTAVLDLQRRSDFCGGGGGNSSFIWVI